MAFLDWQCEECGGIRRNLLGYTSKDPPTCNACPTARPMVTIWDQGGPAISAWERPWKYWDDAGNEKEYKSIADVRNFQAENAKKAADGLEPLMIPKNFEMDKANIGDRATRANPVYKGLGRTKSGQKMKIRQGTVVKETHGD